MKRNTLTLVLLSLNVLTAIYYAFALIPYCNLFGGSCNAGILVIFLLPALFIVEVVIVISMFFMLRKARPTGPSWIAILLLSLCLGLALLAMTMETYRWKESFLFYAPLATMLLIFLVLNFVRRKDG